MATDFRQGTQAIAYANNRDGALRSAEELTEKQAREAERRQAEAEAAEPPPLRFEQDLTARAFRITAADGTVATFRDAPTRSPFVEPDPETGAMRPVMKRPARLPVSLPRRP